MFFFQWDESDWKQPAAIIAYLALAVAGIIYSVLGATDVNTLIRAMSEICGALILTALTTEGAIWTMVMALGKLREARVRGREEGREEGLVEGRQEGHTQMIQAMRDSGIAESDIQRAVNKLNSQNSNNKS